MGANEKAEAAYHGPQTPEDVAERITAHYGTLIVEGVRLPVVVTAVTAYRETIETTPPVAPDDNAWREYQASGLIDIEVKLSGAPELRPVAVDRRERAQHAGLDCYADQHGRTPDIAVAGSIIEAVETATRVRVTGEAVRAMLREVDLHHAWGAPEAALAAALRELGFEVEA